MGLSIQLLGPPQLERNGTPLAAPRGHKAWGLLAYLVLTQLPPSRERLVSLLFAEADDPLGALRWSLSALRQRLGDDVELGGDPLTLTLGPGTHVDVDVLTRGSWTEAVALPGIGHELLDGIAFRSSPGFELWLDNERRHVAGITIAVLHQAALASLGSGEAVTAAGYASEVVRLNPYEENAHVLLVRCLRAGGDAAAAARHVEACTELFRRELGLEPSFALRDALRTPGEAIAGTRVPGRTSVLAQVEAAEAALIVGATESGVLRLRSAVASARRLEDRELLAAALVSLGGALVHSARGTDEEGAVALHEGTVLAEQTGRPDLAARGWREIAWIQFLRAQYERAERSAARTMILAVDLEEELGWAEIIRGCARHDLGDYEAGREILTAALERSERIESGLLMGYALSMLGRLHLMRGEIEDAVHLLDRALAEASARGLTAFVPWPESFRAEIDLALGEVDTAQERFEHAFALGCEVGDPCWEGIAMRGMGLAAAAQGDLGRALELLAEAPRQCRRLPDTYLWIEAYSLDALCSVAVDNGAEAAPRWIDRLESIASRRGIRELVLHAAVYRARLGEPGALAAARSLAAQIDNPSHDRLLASAELAAV